MDREILRELTASNRIGKDSALADIIVAFSSATVIADFHILDILVSVQFCFEMVSR